MEENKEIKVRLSTAICMVIIFALILALGVTYYFGFVADKNDKLGDEEVTNTTENVVSNTKNEVSENVIDNNKENSMDTTNKVEEKKPTEVKGQKLVQFDNEFYELKDIAKDYRNSEKIKNYKDFNYDLDGDGVTDKITIQKNKDSDEESSYIFKLNGKEFVENEYYGSEIYIVDLNESDKSIEVVIYDNGPSDDPGYTIYSKNGNKMIEIVREDGYILKTDKKGTVVFVNSHNRRLNGYTDPEIYFDYYVINNTKVDKKYIDIDKIKDIDFSTSLYFCENYNNKDKFWENFDGVDYKKRFKELNIEELDENTTFNILKFEIVEDEDYKIKVKLSDGRIGYIFDIQLAG